MDLVPYAAARPFAVIQLDGHRRVAALGMAAAATGRADEELAGTAEDVDWLAVGTPDDVAHLGGERRARQARDGIGRGLVVLVLIPQARGLFGGARVDLFGS